MAASSGIVDEPELNYSEYKVDYAGRNIIGDQCCEMLGQADWRNLRKMNLG